MRTFLHLCALMFTTALFAVESATDKAEPKELSASGTFVSFKDGTLTVKGRSGLVTYHHVGAGYKTFENNENGPGSRPVETVEALGRVVPGMVFQVSVEKREIIFGLDHRIIGGFESYQDGKLNLSAADVAPEFISKPAGSMALTIDPDIPVLVSINGDRYKHAGRAGVILKTVKQGTIITARSEYDSDLIEVLQIGDPKQKIERYVGQSRGTVRGSFVSFKDGLLRIRGKGVTSRAANEYDRLITLRITDGIPILESLDGEVYQPADAEALKTAREGTTVTVRKVEEVILEVQIGVARKD